MNKEKYFDQFSNLKYIIEEWIIDELDTCALHYDVNRNLCYISIGAELWIEEGEWNEEEDCADQYQIPIRIYVENGESAGIRIEESNLPEDPPIPKEVIDFFIEYSNGEGIYIDDEYVNDNSELSNSFEERKKRLEDSYGDDLSDKDIIRIFDIIDEEEWEDLWDNEIYPSLDSILWDFEDKYPIVFLEKLDEVMRLIMERRAEEYMDDEVFSTFSFRDYANLIDLDKYDGIGEQKARLIEIMQRYFKWCWGFEENIDTKSGQLGLLSHIRFIASRNK